MTTTIVYSCAALIIYVMWLIAGPGKELLRRHAANTAATAIRYLWCYRRNWHKAQRQTGLTVDIDGTTKYARLLRLRCTMPVERLIIWLAPGMTVAKWQEAGEELETHFGADFKGAEKLIHPRLVRVTMQRRNFVQSVKTTAAIDVPATVRLDAVPVAVSTEKRKVALPLLGAHLLIAGETGSGKGSVIWGLVRSTTPARETGHVQMWGIDPKGGMELGMASHVWNRLVCTDEQAADLLEEAVVLMRARATSLASRARLHTPTSDQPLIIIVIDELAQLTAYAERETRTRIESALKTLLSQGRAPGICIVGALQDPSKETLRFRELFPVRIALRASEPTHTDMVLGTGARAAGHRTDRLPGPGHAYIRVGSRTVQVQFPFIRDKEIQQLSPAPDNEQSGSILELHPDPIPEPAPTTRLMTAPQADTTSAEDTTGTWHQMTPEEYERFRQSA